MIVSLCSEVDNIYPDYLLYNPIANSYNSQPIENIGYSVAKEGDLLAFGQKNSGFAGTQHHDITHSPNSSIDFYSRNHPEFGSNVYVKVAVSPNLVVFSSERAFVVYRLLPSENDAWELETEVLGSSIADSIGQLCLNTTNCSFFALNSINATWAISFDSVVIWDDMVVVSANLTRASALGLEFQQVVFTLQPTSDYLNHTTTGTDSSFHQSFNANCFDSSKLCTFARAWTPRQIISTSHSIFAHQSIVIRQRLLAISIPDLSCIDLFIRIPSGLLNKL